MGVIPFIILAATVISVIARVVLELMYIFTGSWHIVLQILLVFFLASITIFGREQIALWIFGDENYYINLIREATETQDEDDEENGEEDEEGEE